MLNLESCSQTTRPSVAVAWGGPCFSEVALPLMAFLFFLLRPPTGFHKTQRTARAFGKKQAQVLSSGEYHEIGLALNPAALQLKEYAMNPRVAAHLRQSNPLVFCLYPPVSRNRTSPEIKFFQECLAVIREAQSRGDPTPSQLIFVSAIGAGNSIEAIPDMSKDIMAEFLMAKTECETLLQKLGQEMRIPTTIIRPGILEKNQETQFFGCFSESTEDFGCIDPQDCATLIERVLENPPKFDGKTLTAMDKRASKNFILSPNMRRRLDIEDFHVKAFE